MISDYQSNTGGTLTWEEVIPTAIRESTWRGESALMDRDGNEIPVSQVVIAHRSRTGAVDFFSTIARGISDRKQWEAELRQAHKMEAIGRLAGGIAHDFNNLLTVISGYNQLLATRLPQEKVTQEAISQIGKAAERATSLTRQLLAFGRNQILRPVVLNLNTVVGEMGRMMGRLAGESIEITTKLDPTLGCVEADRGQMEQILLNLVMNARDAMAKPGTVTIETSPVHLDASYVRSHPYVQEGSYAMLAVSDTGCGMDKETTLRIFEPFFTTKEVGNGTGLGLATVYGIVKQSKGSIEVFSEVGAGTTFRIFLPLSEALLRPKTASPGLSEIPRGTEIILLVEDEEDVRRFSRAILEANGHTVLVAKDGSEALDIFEKRHRSISLMLTDVVMPGMSGRELADRVKAIKPDIKVLFMSGYTNDAVFRNEMMEKGVYFLQKPFSAASLCLKVRETIDSPQA